MMMNKKTPIFGWLLLALLWSCQETTTIDFPVAEHLHLQVEGFEVQEVMKGSGEWLSIHQDPQGRLLVSPREGNLLRFTLPISDVADLRIDTIDIGVNDCQGVLYAYDHLYMMGTGRDDVRGIYRVPDEDGKGNYGEPILMKEIPQNGDHSGHTLLVGPEEGSLYFLSGNANRPPEGEDVDYVYSNWKNDHLSPLNSIFGGSQKPPGGYVLRTDKEGSEWELIAYGLRNPYDMCFNPEGELFTYDSDMEWDFNLPWYRATRVNHLVSGGDYAWRQSTAKRFDYYPDILPSIKEFGRGSPTATSFGTNAAFPAKYQKALFLGDWSYGKIYAMHLSEDGATYSATSEPFVTGQPLNITDIVIGQDGALYFTTGGNGTDTGLFRIVYKGDESTKQVEETKEVTPEMAIRRELEHYHFSEDNGGLALALEHIDHEDRFVRYAAKTILERNSPATWLSAFNEVESVDGKIALLTALIRTDTTDTDNAIVFDELSAFDFQQLSEMQQLGVLRLYALAFLRSQDIEDEKVEATYVHLLPHYPSSSKLVNRELSRVLSYLASEKGEGKAVVERTFDLLESSDDPIEFVHYLTVMRVIPDGWTMEQRAAYKYWMEYARNSLSGGSLFKYFLDEIEGEFEATLSPYEQSRLTSYPLVPLGEGYEGPVPPKAKLVSSEVSTTDQYTQWTMEDLQFGLELVSSPRSARLRDFNRGQQMYEKGQCYNCHYMINKGGAFGPELTLAGNSFDVEDLLTSILYPSKAINTRYGSTLFELKDGTSVAGRLMSEDDDRYVVQASYDPATAQEVPKNEVAKREEAHFSSMPSGLLNSMSREEIMDLLYFIVQVAKKEPDSLEVAIFNNKTLFEQGESAQIEMINFGKRGDIYYTLDGSEPTTQSKKYTSPFLLNESTLVKAKVIDGEQFGTVQTRAVHVYDPNQNGIQWKLYLDIEEPFQLDANTRPDQSGIAHTFDLRNIVEDENTFELHLDTWLDIEEGGEYTFYSFQDDKMSLYINDELVINGTEQDWGSEAEGKIRLAKGKHHVHIKFYDRMAYEHLEIDYESESMTRRPVPADRLFLNGIELSIVRTKNRGYQEKGKT
ncbi:MAG: FN3 associated domain-containing protein [Bacteroidota bacterium]